MTYDLSLIPDDQTPSSEDWCVPFDTSCVLESTNPQDETAGSHTEEWPESV